MYERERLNKARKEALSEGFMFGFALGGICVFVTYIVAVSL